MPRSPLLGACNVRSVCTINRCNFSHRYAPVIARMASTDESEYTAIAKHKLTSFARDATLLFPRVRSTTAFSLVYSFTQRTYDMPTELFIRLLARHRTADTRTTRHRRELIKRVRVALLEKYKRVGPRRVRFKDYLVS